MRCNYHNCTCGVIHEDKVKNTEKMMLEEDKLNTMADFFKVFSDPTRLKIINVLLCEDMCVSDIAVILNMTHSAISHQLKFLKNYNIVKDTKVGKVVYYKLDDDHIKEIFEKGLEHIREKIYIPN